MGGSSQELLSLASYSRVYSAEVVELVDTKDLKSFEAYTLVPVRFRSSATYKVYLRF